MHLSSKLMMTVFLRNEGGVSWPSEVMLNTLLSSPLVKIIVAHWTGDEMLEKSST